MLDKHQQLKEKFTEPIKMLNTTQTYKKYKDIFG